MPTNLGELRRQVLVKIPMATDGTAFLTIDQCINDAQATIARVQDFDELIVLDTTNAFTTALTKIYHLETDLGLTLPKDIFSIRYMDESNSRKLTFVPSRLLDQAIPYTEITGYGRPSYYTHRGIYIELYRIPDAVKPLYIHYSQWPSQLVYDADETSFTHIDDVIVVLAAEMALSALTNSPHQDWIARAKDLLGIVRKDQSRSPDQVRTAQPFSTGQTVNTGEYWLDPFVKRV